MEGRSPLATVRDLPAAATAGDDSPQLDLVFQAGPAGTWLARRRACYPYVLTGAFTDPDGSALAIPQCSSGGLFAGDALVERVTTGPGARAVVREPAARIGHSRRSGPPARLRRTLVAEPGSVLVWDGQPLVLLPGAALAVDTRILLSRGAMVIWSEAIGQHRPAGCPPAPATLDMALVVTDAEDRPLAEQALRTDLATADGWTGTLLLLSRDPARLEPWLDRLRLPGPDERVRAGLDRLPGQAGLVLQAWSPDADALAAVLTAALAAARGGGP